MTRACTQQLIQDVGQAFGWSIQFFVIEHKHCRVPQQEEGVEGTTSIIVEERDLGCWAVEVYVGLLKSKIFISNDRSPTTLKGSKRGKEAVSKFALDKLKCDITQEYQKRPVTGLYEAMKYHFSVPIVESLDETWDKYIWKKSQQEKPFIVGIDTEGNKNSPPILVQIATHDVVILEAPSANENRQLSSNLQRLLHDDSIVKVFCDCGSQRDLKSLGLDIPQNLQSSEGPIVDLEDLATKLMGPCITERGLAKIVGHAMPELAIRITKSKSLKSKYKDIGTYIAIEQGNHPPLRNIYDLTRREHLYAALDAWCTLQAWIRLEQYYKRQTSAGGGRYREIVRQAASLRASALAFVPQEI